MGLMNDDKTASKAVPFFAQVRNLFVPFRGEHGADLTECVLLVSLIALVCLTFI